MLVRTQFVTGIIATTDAAGPAGSAAAVTVVGVWQGAVTQLCEHGGLP